MNLSPFLAKVTDVSVKLLAQLFELRLSHVNLFTQLNGAIWAIQVEYSRSATSTLYHMNVSWAVIVGVYDHVPVPDAIDSCHKEILP
jgi:hypothetical protein